MTFRQLKLKTVTLLAASIFVFSLLTFAQSSTEPATSSQQNAPANAAPNPSPEPQSAEDDTAQFQAFSFGAIPVANYGTES